MPYDITHCVGQDCPLKESCLHYTAEVGGRRSAGFFYFCSVQFSTHSCDLYWDDRPTEEEIRRLAYHLWQSSHYQPDSALEHWFQARNLLIDQLRNS